uniref:Uncharacterized protein n=1 Tax=Anopheles maculatus TaxID=74869 RepID=A0A182T865_9DIPT
MRMCSQIRKRSSVSTVRSFSIVRNSSHSTFAIIRRKSPTSVNIVIKVSHGKRI